MCIRDSICSIVEDSDNNLWISVSNGISKYNLKTEEFTNYNSLNGIGVYEFTPHSGLLLPNGEICFSGNNGFVTFSPVSYTHLDVYKRQRSESLSDHVYRSRTHCHHNDSIHCAYQTRCCLLYTSRCV